MFKFFIRNEKQSFNFLKMHFRLLLHLKQKINNRNSGWKITKNSNFIKSCRYKFTRNKQLFFQQINSVKLLKIYVNLCFFNSVFMANFTMNYLSKDAWIFHYKQKLRCSFFKIHFQCQLNLKLNLQHKFLQ